MKKLLLIIALCFFLNGAAYADNTITYKCEFERKDYDYTINWYQYDFNNLYLQNDKSKKYYYTDSLKDSVDITVINKNESYNFKGFKNNMSHLEHYLVFIDGANFLYAYIQATKFDTGRPIYWEITSFDNAIDKITKGNCKEFK